MGMSMNLNLNLNEMNMSEIDNIDNVEQGNKRPFNKRLLPRHYKILELFLTGLSIKDVARKVNMTPMGISYIYNSPVFQDALKRRQKGLNEKVDDGHVASIMHARSVLDEASLDASKLHASVVRDDDLPIRERQVSATAILDRVGLGRSERTEKPTVVMISTDQMNVLQVALSESDLIKDTVQETEMEME